MRVMCISLLAPIAGVVLALPAAAAEAPNPERGRALYENVASARQAIELAPDRKS